MKNELTQNDDLPKHGRIVQAQVGKIVSGCTAGGLVAALTSEELTTVTNLTISGVIDSRDFETMNANMPALAVLDIGEVTIDAFNGNPANSIPAKAFYSKSTLTSVVFPAGQTCFENECFCNCSNLGGTLNIPEGVTSIGNEAFRNTAYTGVVITSASVATQLYTEVDSSIKILIRRL